MGEALIALEGGEAGAALALWLALLAAVAHAVFGAINKGGADPYLNRGAINVAYATMAAPVAVFAVPPPTPALWAVLAGATAIHFVYELLQARSYALGGFTLVYPVVRGTGPLLTALAAIPIFGEAFTASQWLGLLMLSGGIYGLGLVNLRAAGIADLAAARSVRAALTASLLTGVMVAVYTTYDAWGIRVAADPFTFLAWFYTLGGLAFPAVSVLRWRAMPPAQRPRPLRLAGRGVLGALVAFASFAPLMLATRLGDVAQAAALRETSVVFAAVIGVVVFRERLGPARLALIAAIAAGAVLITLR